MSQFVDVVLQELQRTTHEQICYNGQVTTKFIPLEQTAISRLSGMRAFTPRLSGIRTQCIGKLLVHLVTKELASK